MTTPSAFELNTPLVPGTENMPHETAYQRLSGYPVVQDTLTQAHHLLQSYASAQALYDRAASLSQQILAKLEPLQLQKRLPLQTVDDYANSTLDYVEKRFPQVKADTNDLIKSARKPADDAAGIAKSYADGITSRLSPVTNQLSIRITQAQDAVHALQEKLTSTLPALPHDKASATDAINAVIREVETLTTYIANNAKEIVPQSAQARAQPLIDGLSEAVAHIKAELTKSDVPLATKASNILAYSQEQLGPLLRNVKDVVLAKKAEAQAVVEEESSAPATTTTTTSTD